MSTTTHGTRNRTDARNQFLADMLCTAVEHQGYGAFSVSAYRWDGIPVRDTYAVIRFSDCEATECDGKCRSHRITLDTIAKGIAVIRNAQWVSRAGQSEGYFSNAVTGQRLYFGGEARRELLLASRTNGDDGDYDVIGALAVVECALFGRVVYG